MTFKKTEKEILQAIVKYGGESKSLAEVLNKSKLLEKRGIAIIHQNSINYVFLDKSKYDDWFNNEAYGYIAEMMSLVERLINNRLIVLIPFESSYADAIGINGLQGIKPDVYRTDKGETICLADRNVNWFDAYGNQKSWPCHYTEKEMPLDHFFNCPFSVSEELRDLVKHGFRTEEQIRFQKQQCLTRISIIVAVVIGISSLIIGIIGILIR
jgi:hypothetical protein